ncbi:MAG: DUF3325 domain-containing protein [Pseudomonadota bacterium]|nr:DUF3325 domain-containing protein [Pseudomonadota bacterium]
MSAWLLICVLVFAFSCLACSMQKHQRDIFTAKISDTQSRLYQIVGWLLLGLMAVIAIIWKGASIGLSEWIGCLTFSALIVGLCMTYFPKKIKWLNVVVGGVFGVLAVIG